MHTKQAQKDARNISRAGLRQKTEELLQIISQDPFRNPPKFERPVGNLQDAISRRINIQHRLIYQVVEEERIVKVLRMWTHYE